MTIDTERNFYDVIMVRHLQAHIPEGGKALCGGSQPNSDLDTGLTAESKEKTALVGEAILKQAKTPIAAVFSSPFKRTRETVQPLAQKLNLPVQETPHLNELNHGALTGMLDGIWQKHKFWLDYDKLPRLQKLVTPQAPGAETNCDVIKRVVQDFIFKLPPNYLGKTVICAASDGTMRAVLNLLELEKHLKRPLGSIPPQQAVEELLKTQPDFKTAAHFANGAVYHIRVYPHEGRIEELSPKPTKQPKIVSRL